MAEVTATIGEPAVAEAFGCFDPWQALKSKCHGKLRIVKQTEARSSKSKKGVEEEDTLQINDPWAEALQNRLVKPEASFFQTTTNQPPVILQTVSHGCTGLAMVDLKEAELLSRSDGDLSPDELAIITLGEPDLPEARRPFRRIEFPCVDHNDMRMLARGTLIDLGAARMKLTGEDAILPMQVVESACIACEIQKADMDDWPEFSGAPVKYLKKALNLTGEDVIHVWGKKWFRTGKVVSSSDQADAAFMMMRVRASLSEAILRVSIPGVFTSPRLESGEPDWKHKIVWCPEKTVSELRVLAASMPDCHGVVKSRTGCGIRVKCTDYSSLRSKLYPDWVPLKDTPYNTSLSLKYELHHVHPGAGKGDLQALINSMSWRALVVRQTRPKQWLVASESPPPRDSILTEHGTILVQLSKLPVDKGPHKGKGKGAKGKSPPLGYSGHTRMCAVWTTCLQPPRYQPHRLPHLLGTSMGRSRRPPWNWSRRWRSA